MANNKKITVDQANALMQGMAGKNDARFVKQVSGKGLSTNDYDAAAKQKLDGITSATTAAEGLVQLSNATDSDAENAAATPKAVKAAMDAANAKQSPATSLSGYGIQDAYTKTEVDNAIAAAASSSYHAGGSKAAADLTSALLVAANDSKVYNLTSELKITAENKDLFTENAEGSYPVGTNVAVINTGTNEAPAYKFDVMAGFVDLSPYAKTEDVEVASEQDIQNIINGLYSE